MTTIKSYTDIEQSKKLAEILPIESADYFHAPDAGIVATEPYKLNEDDETVITAYKGAIPCWSLAALLKYLSEIKAQVYTPILFSSEGKWILQFAEYGHGNVCEVSSDNPVDACVNMIIKLSKLKML